MKPQALNDWQELSALYEQADALEDVDLAAWLAQLRAQAHPLLPQLEQMLAAREQVRNNGFLDAPPALPLAPEPLVHEWQEGSRVGPYRLLRRLGAGGMAEVWLAQRDDGAFQRQVAIKLLFRHASQLGGATASADSLGPRDSFAQRFRRERDILASLHHPHIAGLHDAGVTAAGQPWLALEYVEGEALTAWCDARSLDVRTRIQLFRQVLLAVQHAHANLVIHRDLKPANILVTAQGEVRLLDFGIAKLMEPEGGLLVETELTRMAGRPLTVAYASPEQLLGQPLSTACDVYSLGVVLYELLCGERPYELKHETAAQLEQAILDAEPRPPSRRLLTEAVAQSRGATPEGLRKQLASDLDAITLRALGKRPSQRYGSVEALRADVDRWLAGEPVGARTPSAWYHLRKFVGRHTVGVSLGVAAVVALVAAAGIAVWQGIQAREESARAVAARDFMLNIFQRADQEKSRGATVTARDLLATGRRDVMTRLAGQARLQAELLQGIAKIQHDMGEYDDANSTYAELVRIYSVLGMSRDAALSATDLADNAVYMGDMVRARSLLKEAAAMPGRPDDLALKARIAEIDGWIELSSGSAARARELFLASERDFASALGRDDARTFGARRALGRSERALLHFDAAIDLYEDLKRTAATNPQVLAGGERAAFDWEWVDLLYSAGRYGQALQAVEVVIPSCVQSLGARDQNCLMLFLRRGQTNLRLGNVDQAGSELSNIMPLFDDKTSAPSQADALIFRFRLEAARGSVSPDLEERLRAFGQSGAEVPVNPNFKAAALLNLAEAALRASDPAHARRWLDKVLAMVDQRPPSTSGATVHAYATTLVGIAMLQVAETDAAIEYLEKGQKEFANILGPTHTQARLFALNQALALEQAGRRREAIAITDRLEPELRVALGAGAILYQRIVAFRARLQENSPARSSGQRARESVSTDFFS